jgi:hypothetical protein
MGAWVGQRHYFQWLSPHANRFGDRGRRLRKRPWGRGDPASSQMPHESFCQNREEDYHHVRPHQIQDTSDRNRHKNISDMFVL